MSSLFRSIPTLKVVARPSLCPHPRRALSASPGGWCQPTSSLLNKLSQPAADARDVHNESSNVARIVSLGEQFSKSVQEHKAPGRLRGSGDWSPDVGKAPAAPPCLSSLPPLPETRRMADSYVEMDLRFSVDEELRQDVVGGNQKVRWGKLLEFADSTAGAAAYKHHLPDGVKVADAAKYGIYLVTAAVERLDVLRPLTNPDGSSPDLRFSGHVSYATESTLEVFLRLSTLPAEGSTEKADTILCGRFLMASRKQSGGKHVGPKLLVEGPVEKQLFQMGKELREAKKARGSVSLSKVPPTEEEGKLLHNIFVGRSDLYERGAGTPEDVIFMRDTVMSSSLITQPVDRNVHNKIFGGWLMRVSYELAFSNASRFAKSPVAFLALDELQFISPVEIGHLLTLESKVTYSPSEMGEHRSFHVSVSADTTELIGKNAGTEPVRTVLFNFTFVAQDPLTRQVLPKSYNDAMVWLDSRRRRQIGISIRRGYVN